jgi:DNA-binding MarR family transcriptional regulator/N-acetylglutamate synthase-like GNAT family acetyltransferase
MAGLETQVNAVRSFNRFYTRQIGLLNSHYLRSPFSLAEVRVLYELAHRDGPAAKELGRELGLDAGYLSRILVGFEKQGLIVRKPSKTDARQSHLSLTKKGRKAFSPLETQSHEEIAAMLARMRAGDQKRLVESMRRIEKLLGACPARESPYTLRPHRPGDMGWVIHRHGMLYAQEYGWDERFEALVAEIAAHFIQNFDAKRERCWIAERDGEMVGSVFLVAKSQRVAKLRLLLVEPSARGLGIGNRLVEECIQFAREAGYRSIVLWTQSILLAARHIYKKAGFRLIEHEPHCSFGFDLVSETWELALDE